MEAKLQSMTGDENAVAASAEAMTKELKSVRAFTDKANKELKGLAIIEARLMGKAWGAAVVLALREEKERQQKAMDKLAQLSTSRTTGR